ncbi:hypothetical protein ElyMa_003808100 [Elysia marginata]|uniref:Secreted protein n=1 Tax=Elysia marginata TaxID=1093978 RepID=A0AAV4FEI0_9GAST|nr:hypothetical protein ElyMa_003808100 [Elysia marginata]
MARVFTASLRVPTLLVLAFTVSLKSEDAIVSYVNNWRQSFTLRLTVLWETSCRNYTAFSSSVTVTGGGDSPAAGPLVELGPLSACGLLIV